MFVEERHQEILYLLQENEKVKVKELSKQFEVTEDCIRKDLASMEAKNLLKELMEEQCFQILCIRDIQILYQQEKIRI